MVDRVVREAQEKAAAYVASLAEANVASLAEANAATWLSVSPVGGLPAAFAADRPEEAAEAGAWVCPFCKFLNENMTARRCVVCDAPRLSAAELAEQREIVRSLDR